MKRIVFTGLLLALGLCGISYQVVKSNSDTTEITNQENNRHQIIRLNKAENEKDLEQIRRLFAKDALILLPDARPVAGHTAICALYEFSWEKNKNTSSEYRVDSIVKHDKLITEYGQYHSFSEKVVKETIPFHAKYRKTNNDWLITELSFGNSSYEGQMPELPKPTGQYNIGQAIYFYEKEQTTINRIISFQVWFPAQQCEGEKLKYRSSHAAQAAAEFLGWPLFGNSFVTLLETNTYKNAAAVPNKKFPVLIYNHGYGGFSGVYQTVFEELASHGYIVVSIGHQDESALLQIDEEIVLPNPPENNFYRKRSSELNGEKVNQLQLIILNSDHHDKVKKAYRELLNRSPLHNESVELWAKDTKEVILKLSILNRQDKQLNGALDLDNIGVFGHSVGGATAGELAYSCPQIKAGINLDGFQFGNLIDNKLQVPFLFVSSNAGDNTYLRVSPFADASQNPVHHVVIKGFTHEMFSDLPVLMNNNHKAIHIQRSIILNYFNHVFKKLSKTELKQALSEFEEVEIKSYSNHRMCF